VLETNPDIVVYLVTRRRKTPINLRPVVAVSYAI